MKMKLENGILYIADIDSGQYAIIKSWNLTKYNRSAKWIEGPATLELLTRLSKMVRLPGLIEEERLRLEAIQKAVDEERLKDEPVALYRYPVKIKLFQHQMRAANMALLSFGLIDPKNKVLNSGYQSSQHGFGLLFEMGCGKTLTAIAIAGALYQMGIIKSVLIVAPTSVCPVWPKDMGDYADFRFRVGVLTGTKEHRLRELEAVKNHPLEVLQTAMSSQMVLRFYQQAI